jgi:hypothetical protein
MILRINPNELYPPGNYAGYDLLSRALSFGAMLAAVDADPGGSGELNRCEFVFVTRNRAMLLDYLKMAMTAFALIQWTTLGYRCEKELIWRCVHPGPDVRFDPFEDIERNKAIQAELERKIRDGGGNT